MTTTGQKEILVKQNSWAVWDIAARLPEVHIEVEHDLE
ncbi:hypothetical protein M2271_000260 [Streptomyces sp. LBL]|nr:hypothetical protein [Streptomyces sp. LBL]